MRGVLSISGMSPVKSRSGMGSGGSLCIYAMNDRTCKQKGQDKLLILASCSCGYTFQLGNLHFSSRHKLLTRMPHQLAPSKVVAFNHETNSMNTNYQPRTFDQLSAIKNRGFLLHQHGTYQHLLCLLRRIRA